LLCKQLLIAQSMAGVEPLLLIKIQVGNTLNNYARRYIIKNNSQ